MKLNSVWAKVAQVPLTSMGLGPIFAKAELAQSQEMKQFIPQKLCMKVAS